MNSPNERAVLRFFLPTFQRLMTSSISIQPFFDDAIACVPDVVTAVFSACFWAVRRRRMDSKRPLIQRIPQQGAPRLSDVVRALRRRSSGQMPIW